MKYLFLLPLLLIACGGSDEDGSSKSSLEQAMSDSPSGEVCVFGEVENIFVPANRGRGNDHGEWQEVDNRTYEPAFWWGDVNFDGVIADRADAKEAVKGIYIKQIESQPCPAVADIGIFPQGFGRDGFFTAEDINQWNKIKHGAAFQGGQHLICQSQCLIQNHMSPGNK